jgi:dTDP-4-amino-4,6-dideoxygalactose transaminase
MGFRVGDYPNAEEYFSQAITLPIFPRLKKFEHELVVDELRRAINGD